MGYFSNSTAGHAYEAKYCSRCIHDDYDKGCAVMLLHLVWNYDQNKDDTMKFALDALIPRDGIENKRCELFIQKEIEDGR